MRRSLRPYGFADRFVQAIARPSYKGKLLDPQRVLGPIPCKKVYRL